MSKKKKAVFLITIMIAAIFNISLLSDVVDAQTIPEGNACCQKTIDDEYCQYTNVNDCDPDFKSAFTLCENTNYCQLGCCFSSDDGRCFSNSPRTLCEAKDGTFDLDATCDSVLQCQRGCCSIGNENSFVTLTQCKQVTSQFPNVEMQFDPSVLSEVECLEKARTAEKGCCVNQDECVFTTRASCNTVTDVNFTTGFFKDTFCSDDSLTCECAPEQNKGCLPNEDDVYWFDSCGNPEDIAEECDYASGTLCGLDEDDEYSCLTTSCTETYKDEASPDSGGTKKSGESWCIYDGAVGFGTDLVGSRHYRFLCANGNELVEPCRDFRGEFCISANVDFEAGIQGIADSPFNPGEGEFVEAACRTNRWESCRTCNGKNCCEQKDIRDCLWIPGKGKNKGQCVPQVPPGFRFWEGEGKDICSRGNVDCTVRWEKKGMFQDWECVENCHCLGQGWLKASNSFCKALGDCGAYFNIAGDLTKGGFSSTRGKLSDASVGSFTSLKRGGAPLEDEDQSTWQKAWDALKVGLIVSGLTGAATWVTAKVTGAEIGWLTGFSSGFKGIAALPKSAFDRSIEPFKEVAKKSFAAKIPPSSTSEIGEIVSSGNIQSIVGQQVGAQPTTLTYQIANPTAFKSPQHALAEFSEKLFEVTGGEPGGIFIPENAISTSGNSFTILTQPGATIPSVEGFPLAHAQGGTLAQPLQIPAQSTSLFSTTIGQILTIANTIAWIYTIYKVINLFFQDDKEETYAIKCKPWVPPKGGSKCEDCNLKENKPCTEYSCQSYGQNCELLNEGTGNETCVDLTPYDTNSPIIKPLEDVLGKNFSVSKLSYGYRISPNVKPFSMFAFGVLTDEPSQCKITDSIGKDFDEIDTFLGDSLFTYRHQITMNIPKEVTDERVLEITNGGKFDFYVRCADGNDNQNERDYIIQFEVDKGPDLTAPSIEATSILNGAYIANSITETELSIFTNEPAQCRWSFDDTDFEIMPNEFECASSGLQQSPNGLYECQGVLTGIFDNTVNDYNIRCKDLSENAMQESYVFTLLGTIPLQIIDIEPTGEVFNPTLTVVTDGGALQDGTSICGFGLTDDQDAMIAFFMTDSDVHEQSLFLEDGTYTYFVQCEDIAGNTASAETTFTAMKDDGAPEIIRIFEDRSLVQTVLHVTTDEPTTCEFKTTGQFTFGQGVDMPTAGTVNHEAPWGSTVYYVICQDEHGNTGPLTVIYP